MGNGRSPHAVRTNFSGLLDHLHLGLGLLVLRPPCHANAPRTCLSRRHQCAHCREPVCAQSQPDGRHTRPRHATMYSAMSRYCLDPAFIRTRRFSDHCLAAGPVCARTQPDVATMRTLSRSRDGRPSSAVNDAIRSRLRRDQVLRPSTPGSGFVGLLLMREQTTGERGGTDVLSMGILGT